MKSACIVQRRREKYAEPCSADASLVVFSQPAKADEAADRAVPGTRLDYKHVGSYTGNRAGRALGPRPLAAGISVLLELGLENVVGCSFSAVR